MISNCCLKYITCLFTDVTALYFNAKMLKTQIYISELKSLKRTKCNLNFIGCVG